MANNAISPIERIFFFHFFITIKYDAINKTIHTLGPLEPNDNNKKAEKTEKTILKRFGFSKVDQITTSTFSNNAYAADIFSSVASMLPYFALANKRL